MLVEATIRSMFYKQSEISLYLFRDLFAFNANTDLLGDDGLHLQIAWRGTGDNLAHEQPKTVMSTIGPRMS